MSSSQTQRDILWIARFLTERASLAPGLLDGPAFASAVRGRMSQLAMADIAKYAAVVEQNEYEMQSCRSSPSRVRYQEPCNAFNPCLLLENSATHNGWSRMHSK